VKRLPIIAFIFGILFFSTVAIAQQADAAKKVRSEMLVTTQWLADHAKDPNVVVLHVGDRMNDYKRGHIPGARFLQYKTIAEDVNGVSVELPAVERLQKVFSDLGIGDKTRVVIYTTSWQPDAARVWFTLDYLGHGENAALLDGGIDQWLNENRPVSGDSPKFSPATFTPRANEKLRAMLDEVKAVSEAKAGDADSQILDARPARRYTAGHISGSTNIYWQDTLVSEEKPVFQSPEKLQALYAQRGITPGKKVITYCEVGMQASHGFFLAKYLGYDAAMYDGSYSEWNSMKKMPVVTGEAKTAEAKAPETK
jgi:thiosulfate/3-mercaptopyruvate sulfurtransferase